MRVSERERERMTEREVWGERVRGGQRWLVYIPIILEVLVQISQCHSDLGIPQSERDTGELEKREEGKMVSSLVAAASLSQYPGPPGVA